MGHERGLTDFARICHIEALEDVLQEMRSPEGMTDRVEWLWTKGKGTGMRIVLCYTAELPEVPTVSSSAVLGPGTLVRILLRPGVVEFLFPPLKLPDKFLLPP